MTKTKIDLEERVCITKATLELSKCLDSILEHHKEVRCWIETSCHIEHLLPHLLIFVVNPLIIMVP